MAGKGSKRRKEDSKKIRDNWDKINWCEHDWDYQGEDKSGDDFFHCKKCGLTKSVEKWESEW